MKANELKTSLDNEQERDLDVVVRDDDFYQNHREEAMESYLRDVGPISEYINKNLDAIKKSGREK